MQRTLVCCAALFAVAGCGPRPRVHTGKAPQFTVQALPGASDAIDLNDAGDVVGRNPDGEVIVWRSGVPARPLGIHERWAEIGGINGRGDLAVTMAARTEGGPSHAHIVRGAEVIDLGTAGGGQSVAADINDAGQVAGRSAVVMGKYQDYPCLWTDGRAVLLKTPGNGTGAAASLNERGDVVGSATDGEGRTRAMLWRGGKAQELGAVGGEQSSATDVNSGGVVVGWSGVSPDSNRSVAVAWRGGGPEALTSRNGRSSVANAINRRGDIVGRVAGTDDRTWACLWAGGRVVNLTRALPAGSRWTLREAHAINAGGQILCSGTFRDRPAWCVLTPKPAR